MPDTSTPGGDSQAEPRRVHCIKLGKVLPGLAAKPFPNELGQRLYDQVSLEGWQQWLVQSRTLINEYRLNLATPEGRKLLMEACERFFFSGENTLPPEYTPPPSKPSGDAESGRTRD